MIVSTQPAPTSSSKRVPVAIVVVMLGAVALVAMVSFAAAMGRLYGSQTGTSTYFGANSWSKAMSVFSVGADLQEEEERVVEAVVDAETLPPLSTLEPSKRNKNPNGDPFRLPRTHEGPYNEIRPGVKYFIYSPSGGSSNQRVELEYALVIGRILGRTVLVPQLGKHTQLWRKYEELDNRYLFPMDRLLDFESLSQYNPIVPIDMPVHPFVEKLIVDLGASNVQVAYSEQRSGWGEKELEPFKASNKKVLYFRGAEMYHRWFEEERMTEVRRAARYAKTLRDAALDAINAAFPDGPQTYDAMHVRLGDYTSRQVSAATFVKRGLNAGFTTTTPVFVATEPNHPPGYFNALCQPTGKFKCIFSDQLSKDVVERFTDSFPAGQIRNDMLGLMEQLICVAAKNFVSTDFSNFSAYIRFMRRNRRIAFPEAMRSPPLPAAA